MTETLALKTGLALMSIHQCCSQVPKAWVWVESRVSSASPSLSHQRRVWVKNPLTESKWSLSWVSRWAPVLHSGTVKELTYKRSTLNLSPLRRVYFLISIHIWVLVSNFRVRMQSMLESESKSGSSVESSHKSWKSGSWSATTLTLLHLFDSFSY